MPRSAYIIAADTLHRLSKLDPPSEHIKEAIDSMAPSDVFQGYTDEELIGVIKFLNNTIDYCNYLRGQKDTVEGNLP